MAALPHSKRLPNLDEVRSIGIVLPLEPTAEERRVLQFFDSHMAKRDIVVTRYHLPAADDKESLSRIGLIGAEHLATFAARTYDIVIAAAPAGDSRTLHAVLSTPSHLRIAYDDTTQIPSPITIRTYDLFIRAGGPCDITNYLREILILLTKIEK